MENPLIWLIRAVINLAIWAIIIQIVLSWLIYFGIVNAYQPFVRNVGGFLNAVTEPLYRPFRSFIPAINGFDVSPIATILALNFIDYSIVWLVYG